MSAATSTMAPEEPSRTPRRKKPEAPPAAQPERLLSAEEVARACSTSLRSVRGWISSGALPSVLLGRRTRRIPLSSLEAFVASRKAAGRS